MVESTLHAEHGALNLVLPASGPKGVRLVGDLDGFADLSMWVQPGDLGVASFDDAIAVFERSDDGDAIVFSLAETSVVTGSGRRLVVADGARLVAMGSVSRTVHGTVAREDTVTVVSGDATIEFVVPAGGGGTAAVTSVDVDAVNEAGGESWPAWEPEVAHAQALFEWIAGHWPSPGEGGGGVTPEDVEAAITAALGAHDTDTAAHQYILDLLLALQGAIENFEIPPEELAEIITTWLAANPVQFAQLGGVDLETNEPEEGDVAAWRLVDDQLVLVPAVPKGAAAALHTLVWDDDAYVPANGGAVPAGAPRRFVGPVDPTSEPGGEHELVDADEWIEVGA